MSNGYNNYSNGASNRYAPRSSGERGYNGNGNGSPNTNYPRNNSNGRSGSSNSNSNNGMQSSSGPTLYNSAEGKFLDFGYWKTYAQITIGTVAPGATMTKDARRSAQKISQVINFETMSEIWDICEEILDSLKNTGNFTSTGIRIEPKMDSIVEISNGENISRPRGIYLVLYKNVDASGRTNEMDIYPFTESKIIRDYDHNSGSSKSDAVHAGQFKKFYRMIKEACKAFTMAQAHATVYTSDSGISYSFRALAAISRSLGVSTENQSSNRTTGGNRYGSNSNGNNGGYRSTFENPGAMSAVPNYNTGASMNDPADIQMSMNDFASVNMPDFK